MSDEKKSPPVAVNGFVRFFNEISVRYPESLLISAYVLNGAEWAIMHVPSDQYILNVMYYPKKYVSEGDSQLFITGTIGRDEKSIDSCSRELAKETRFMAKTEHLTP
ncbi:MAG: hypothetical protein Harvfovirus68_1, partial [Harvfovirus sp.]